MGNSFFSLAPLAGRVEWALPRAGALKIGPLSYVWTRGEAPSPGAQARADLSPRAGRGTRIQCGDANPVAERESA